MKCERCQKRKSIIDFTQSTLSYIHGFITKLCRECYIEIIEEKKKEIDENLIEQKKLLSTENEKAKTT